jgi:signal transduction histidine kinase
MGVSLTKKTVHFSLMENQKRILIIEDDPSSQKALNVLLKDYGELITVGSGNRAINVLKQQSFDLILTDYQMNDGNGIDVIKYAHQNHSDVPIILITSYGTKAIVADALNLHVFGFIEKPFTCAMVEELVQNGLKRKEDSDKNKTFIKIGEKTGQLLHDLVNPLMVIDLKSAELEMQAKNENNVALQEQLSRVSRSSDRMKDLIENTKNILRGERSTVLEVIKLNDLLAEAKESCEIYAKNHSVDVSIISESPIVFSGHRGELLSAFINLLNNAIDAAEALEQKWVKIEAGIVSEGVFPIKFTDSGMGIPESIRSKIFDNLFTTKGSNGTGLGLNIVQQIIHRHGGQITVNDSSPNTQFVVTLPLRAVDENS